MTIKTDSVSVKFPAEKTAEGVEIQPEREFSQGYSVEVFESSDDILEALQDKKKATDILERLNYAFEFRARTNARNKINSEQAAPERAFDKQVKAFMKSRELAGKPVSEEKARQVIKAMLDAE